MPRPISPPHLTKHGNIFYIAYHDGKRPRKFSTRTQDYEVALHALAQFLAERNAPPKGGVTRDVAWCCNYYAAAKNKKLADLVILKPILANLGELPAESITPAICREYVAKRVSQKFTRKGWKKPKQVKAVSAKRELAYLRAATTLCWNEKQIPHPGTFAMPEETPPREEFLLEHEAHALLDAAPAHLRLYILLGLGTGARNGALVGVKWSDVTWAINSEFGQIDFRRFDTARHGKRRGVVPLLMDSALYKALVEAKKNALTDYVVEFKGAPIAYPGKGLVAVSKRAGIRRTTPHMLKHTAITWMLTKGVPVADVSDYTQTSVATIMRVYGHLLQGRGERVARLLQSF
jgi:integrase